MNAHDRPAPDLVMMGNLLVDDIVLQDGTTLMGEPGGAILHAALAASFGERGWDWCRWWAMTIPEQRFKHWQSVESIWPEYGTGLARADGHGCSTKPA